mgnify:CR=1 FL=1
MYLFLSSIMFIFGDKLLHFKRYSSGMRGGGVCILLLYHTTREIYKEYMFLFLILKYKKFNSKNIVAMPISISVIRMSDALCLSVKTGALHNEDCCIWFPICSLPRKICQSRLQPQIFWSCMGNQRRIQDRRAGRASPV